LFLSRDRGPNALLTRRNSDEWFVQPASSSVVVILMEHYEMERSLPPL